MLYGVLISNISDIRDREGWVSAFAAPFPALDQEAKLLEGREILHLKSLREQVYEHLRRAINGGDLAQGVFINQKKLAADLGISRQPLRDALIQLEIEGFVTVLPRRGVLVNRLKLFDIRHLYEIIGGLEGVALKGVAPLLGQRDLARMRDLNDHMVEAVERGDFNRYYELNLAFHDVFLDLSGNSGLVRTVRICKQRLYDFPRERRFNREWELESTKEHAEIVELLETGQPREAADYLRDVHWSFSAQESYIRAYYHLKDPPLRVHR